MASWLVLITLAFSMLASCFGAFEGDHEKAYTIYSIEIITWFYVVIAIYIWVTNLWVFDVVMLDFVPH